MANFYARICSFTVISIILSLTLPVMSHPPTCSAAIDTGPVTPTIPLIAFLEQVQETALNTFGPKNFDPKLYIDFSLKSNLSITQQAFARLSRTQNGVVSAVELQRFIQEHFNGAGDDLIYAKPADFVAEPHGFLPKVKNPDVRAWALQVHSLWKNLSRKVSPAVKEHPELHTLLPVPESCIIPGSRFREVYYWDSYWVIRFDLQHCFFFNLL